MSMPEAVLDALIDRFDELALDRAKFFAAEGVAAILLADDRAREGLLAAEAAGPFRSRDPVAPPTFVVTAEQYGRLARMADQKQPVRVRLELETKTSRDDVDGINIVGEIPGGAKRDEVVMVGAHFDSWHAATGATDNGAGSAVMIEVMRILEALHLRLDRTIRIALWGGEEQGLLGSRAYVKAHFADPRTMQLREEHAKLSGYYNLDNGSGRIRGVYLQGHEAMRPLFDQWLAPFRDLGVTTSSVRNTGGTDHLSFTRVGLPAFQFIQDPLDYESVTHHTSADTYDHAVAADLMQAAAVIASVVYQTANRPERLPRRELPVVSAAR
jgi:Zn-dependent M28 family amino/carboxypeptidase